MPSIRLVPLLVWTVSVDDYDQSFVQIHVNVWLWALQIFIWIFIESQTKSVLLQIYSYNLEHQTLTQVKNYKNQKYTKNCKVSQMSQVHN